MIKEPVIAIIGLGYVGLPLAVEFAKKYKTFGFDIKQSRITELNSAKDSTLEVSAQELNAATNLSFTSNPEVIIYRAENIYGEERYKILNEAVKLIENNKEYWLDQEIAVINNMLGDYHVKEENLSLIYYKKAQKQKEE